MLGILDLQGKRIVEQPAVLEVRLLGHSKMKLFSTIAGHIRLLARMARARWSLARRDHPETATPPPTFREGPE